jgi:hypothetical protein
MMIEEANVDAVNLKGPRTLRNGRATAKHHEERK